MISVGHAIASHHPSNFNMRMHRDSQNCLQQRKVEQQFSNQHMPHHVGRSGW